MNRQPILIGPIDFRDKQAEPVVGSGFSVNIEQFALQSQQSPQTFEGRARGRWGSVAPGKCCSTVVGAVLAHSLVFNEKAGNLHIWTNRKTKEGGKSGQR